MNILIVKTAAWRRRARALRIALLPGTGLDDPTYGRIVEGLCAELRRQGWRARGFCPKRCSQGELIRFRPDILHLHCSGHLGGRARRWLEAAARRPVQLILTFQDLDHPDLPAPDADSCRRIAGLVARASRVTALTPALARGVLLRYPKAAGKISVVGNGVAREWFRGEAPCRDGATIVAAARLSPYKGIDLLLWAFCEFCRRAPDARLLIFGKDFQDGHYQGLARRLDLMSRVRFAGSVTGARLRAALHGARIFVSPSRRETYGMAVLEALACGTAVLAARTGAASQLLRHGRDAWLVPPGDWRALERGLSRLWPDASLRRRLGRAGRAAARRATWERRAREYGRLYASAWDGGWESRRCG